MQSTTWRGQRYNTITRKDENVIIHFIHNGSYTGDVRIELHPDPHHLGMEGEVLEIPFEALAELVGQAVQSNKICDLENKSGIEVLGL